MEVSGRLHAGSDDTNTGLLCDPCVSVGDTENAENYCVDCQEFLCLTCAKVHRKQAISRGHQLLGRDQMPKKKMGITSEQACSKHDGKMFDYFCKNHDVLCCSVCLNLDHRQCAAEYITDLMERFETSEEYEALRTKIQNLDELIGETKTRADSNITASKRSADQFVSDIKTFRAEINSYLDSLEKEALNKVDKVREEDIQKISAIAEELDTMQSELDALTVKMEGFSTLNRKKDIVIATKLNNTRVTIIENQVGILTEQNTVRQFQFCRNDQILGMLRSTDIGKLEEKKQSDKGPLEGNKIDKAVNQIQPYNVKYQGEVNIKHTEDKNDCSVSGCVMMDTGRLAITDALNYSVKVVDTHQGNILSYTRLSSPMWDITYTDQNQLIVTAPDLQTLVFLDVGKKLTVKKELKVDGECRGIDYTDNKLIVSFIYPGSVKILNMEGHVLSSFSKDPNGEALFTYPGFVISSADSSAIYVSDWKLNTVTKLDMTGKATYKYTSNEESKIPYGIVVDEYDNLYIAGRGSSTVFILSAEGKQIYTIKVDRPVSVALCEDTDQLYVSHAGISSSKNSLSVYKLH